MIKSKAADIATTLHFFVTGILDQEEESTPEAMGMGQDGFVYFLFNYAEMIDKAFLTVDGGRDAPGVFDYDISETVAPQLFLTLHSVDKLKMFEPCINMLVLMWCLQPEDKHFNKGVENFMLALKRRYA